MPEMPEVQALAERLAEHYVGAKLERITPLSFSALKTVRPAPESLLGRELIDTDRRGKYLVFDFGGPRLLIHLGQAGRVDLETPPKTTKPKGALVRLQFEGRGAMLLKEHGTERRAGWWVLDADECGPLDDLGPEALSEEFATFLRTSDDSRRLHNLLRDQDTVAGIGRGFADDILHEAHLSPYATLRSLTSEQREALVVAVHRCLSGGLEHDRQRTGGLAGKLGDQFRIHKRHGQPCPRCATVMHRISYASYEVTYCATCQTNGKVLADRRMSKLLR